MLHSQHPNNSNNATLRFLLQQSEVGVYEPAYAPNTLLPTLLPPTLLLKTRNSFLTWLASENRKPR